MKTPICRGLRSSFSLVLGMTGILSTRNPGFAQDWTITNIPHDAWNSGWNSIATSADGRRLLAAGGFVHCFFGCEYLPLPLYTSADFGVTWTHAAWPSNYWASVASSADGARLVAAATLMQDNSTVLNGDGLIYISPDSGATWRQTTAPSNFWSCVASSAGGTRLVATALRADVNDSPGSIYTSSDSGATWVRTTAPSNYWRCVASSADGTQLTAGSSLDFAQGNQFGLIYRSTDSGATWTATSAPTNNWVSIAASADGSRLIAAPGGYGTFDLIYISTNSGQSWQPAGAPTNSWMCVASSAEGTTLVAAASKALPLFGVEGGDGLIYTSFDFGENWMTNNLPASTWRAVACSADGIKLAAASRDSAPAYEAGAVWVGSYTGKAEFPPRLRIRPSGQSIVVSWLVSSSFNALEETPDLTSPGWAFTQTPPILNFTNLHHEVTVNPSRGENRFYRLRSEP